MKKFFIGAVLFALPMFASAANFAQSPIFLSKTPAVEGQKVRVYTIISNDSTSAFSGIVTITVDGVKIGSPAIALAAGATQTVSAAWVPTAGSHAIAAQLVADDGTVIQNVSQPVAIQGPPAPTSSNSSAFNQSASGARGSSSLQAATASGVQPSTEIQKSIGTVSPAAEKYSAPVFQVIDSGRVAAAKQLNTAIDWSKQQAGVPAGTKGTSIFTAAAPSASKGWSAGGILSTVLLYVLSVLLFVVSSAGIFYPVLAIIFFYILWKLWRRYRRKY